LPERKLPPRAPLAEKKLYGGGEGESIMNMMPAKNPNYQDKSVEELEAILDGYRKGTA